MQLAGGPRGGPPAPAAPRPRSQTSSEKNAIIIALVGLLIWFGAALARVENERYARSLSMCPHITANGVQLGIVDCTGIETIMPPAWLWHIAYASGVL